MMSPYRTERFSLLPRGLALVVLISSLAGCSSPPGAGEPTPQEVRQHLAEALLNRDQPLELTEFREEGEGQFAGKARGRYGVTYQLTVTTQGRRLTYKAESNEGVLGGTAVWSEPPWSERHPREMQWLRAGLFVIQSLGVIWPVLGRFGYRRRYSPRVEMVLTLFAAANLGCACLWAYQFVTNWNAG